MKSPAPSPSETASGAATPSAHSSPLAAGGLSFTQRKLDQIARLSARELSGWVWVLKNNMRPPFDGEWEAITRRAKVLGLTKIEGSL